MVSTVDRDRQGSQRELPGERTKYLLDEQDIPRSWYNIQADLPAPVPAVLHPGTGQPIGPADLAPLFPMEIIKQEVPSSGTCVSGRGRDA